MGKINIEDIDEDNLESLLLTMLLSMNVIVQNQVQILNEVKSIKDKLEPK